MDSYTTLAEPASAVFREKGSRFWAFAFPVGDEQEFGGQWDRLKKEYYYATHHCYAYVLPDGKTRANDDGEPSGTAGLPILQQLRSHGLAGVGLVVVRYFGGTKLGAQGLVQAYKTAAQMALQSAKTTQVYVIVELSLVFPAEQIGAAMRLLKSHHAKITRQTYEPQARIDFDIRKADLPALTAAISYPFELSKP